MGQREINTGKTDIRRLEAQLLRMPPDDEGRRAQRERILNTYIKWLKDLDRKNGK